MFSNIYLVSIILSIVEESVDVLNRITTLCTDTFDISPLLRERTSSSSLCVRPSYQRRTSCVCWPIRTLTVTWSVHSSSSSCGSTWNLQTLYWRVEPQTCSMIRESTVCPTKCTSEFGVLGGLKGSVNNSMWQKKRRRFTVSEVYSQSGHAADGLTP